jgi:hypothetical protein
MGDRISFLSTKSKQMTDEQFLNSFPQIFEEMPAVCDLDGSWSAFAHALRIGASSISTHNLYSRMGT